MSQQEDDLRALAKIMDFLRAISIVLVVINLYWFFPNKLDAFRKKRRMAERDLLLVEPAIEILRHYRREDVKANEYIFPLLSNDAEYASYITQADKDRMRPELRHKMYQDISAKNALINKYLKKIAEKAEIEKPLSMHISRHSFAHIAQESGAESSAAKSTSTAPTSTPFSGTTGLWMDCILRSKIIVTTNSLVNP